MAKSIVIELRNIVNLVKRSMHASSEFPLENGTELHGLVIEYLISKKEQDVYQKDLEEEFMMRKSTISRMLKLMEKNGCIKRESVGQDARLKKIILTEQSIELHDIISKLGKDLDDKMMHGIRKEDLDVFYKVLDQIKKNLEE